MIDRPIVILMGGQSKRMGRDKAFVDFQGKTFLEHQIKKLSKYSESIYLSVNKTQYERLKDHYNCILDLVVDKGPIGGIASALDTIQKNVIIVAIDMPNLSDEMMSELFQAAHSTCFQLNGKIAPLPSFWEYKTLDRIQEFINHKEYKLSQIIEQLNFNLILTNSLHRFTNINRPEDLF